MARLLTFLWCLGWAALWPISAPAGDDPSLREMQVFRIEEKILGSYQKAHPDLRAQLLRSIEARILGWRELKTPFAGEAKDALYQGYERVRGLLQVDKLDGDQEKTIRSFLGKMRGEDVVGGLASGFSEQSLGAAIKDLKAIGYSDQHRLEAASSAKLEQALEGWVKQWKPEEADPATLEARLALLGDAAQMAGAESPLPPMVVDFAVSLAKASRAPAGAALTEKLNPCLEKIRASKLVGARPDSLKSLKEEMKKLFCFTPRSTTEGIEQDLVTPKKKELLAAARAESVARAELVAVDSQNPRSKDPARRIEAQDVDAAEDFYLPPGMLLLLTYRLSSREAPAAGAAAGPRTVSLLLDAYRTKTPGKTIRASLPQSYLPGRAYVYVESLPGSPAFWVDSSCWTWEKVINRLGLYLESRASRDRPSQDRESAVALIDDLLKSSIAPAGSLPDRPKILQARDQKSFQSLFSAVDSKEVFLLARQASSPAEALSQLFRRGALLADWEDLPNGDLAQKLLDPTWKGLLGFDAGKAACLLDSNLKFTSEAPAGAAEACGICTVIPLIKR